jgi:hypothetical protein
MSDQSALTSALRRAHAARTHRARTAHALNELVAAATA